MNRFTMCVVGLLLGAGCDWMKASETRSARTTEPTIAPTSPEVRRQAGAGDTKKTEGTRDDTVNAMDQGNSAAETAISASIRKDVMAEASLSFTAKNVKVITTGSRVTLKGPVTTQAEKSLIGAVATRTSGVTEIDNQLEVQP